MDSLLIFPSEAITVCTHPLPRNKKIYYIVLLSRKRRLSISWTKFVGMGSSYLPYWNPFLTNGSLSGTLSEITYSE